ncbi:hypothetical protein IJS77_03825, partial [bacterium]|nr:hypothetical protein [bacterium]
MKKIVTYFILVTTLTFFNLPAFAVEDYNSSGDIIRGHVEVTDQDAPKGDYFTGEQSVMDKGDTINMSVTDVMSVGYTQEGDEFFAEVTGEVSGKNGVIIPVGTVAHGRVRQIAGSKRLGRDGWIELKFDSLIMPDGREIPIDAQMTTKNNVVKGTAIKVAQGTGYTLMGGMVGGLMALNILGLEAAIASNGYTLAGGAAIGGAVGLGVALYRKGKDVLLSPGDEIKVKILHDLDLPVINEEYLKQDEIFYDGLDVQINEVSVVKDPFGEKNTISVDMVIYNSSPKNFSTLDISLVNEMNKSFYPSVFGDAKFKIQQIKSGERSQGKLFFAVDNPSKPHWLVFYDRRTQKPLTKISLDNALRAIDKANKEKKSKKKEKVSI